MKRRLEDDKDDALNAALSDMVRNRFDLTMNALRDTLNRSLIGSLLVEEADNDTGLSQILRKRLSRVCIIVLSI